MSVKTFFDELCPFAFSAENHFRHPLGGRFAFDLGGPGGGRWTVDLGHGAIAVGLHPSDLHTRAQVEDFEELLAGQFDFASALATRRVVVRGDLRLFSRLAAFTTSLNQLMNGSSR